jgi:hypothetical protein
LPFSAGAPTIDNATGLPLPQEAPPWKDPDWPEPDITLTNVFYDGLPLTEVVNHLREAFKEQFDILLPASLPSSSGLIDPGSFAIKLRLKNVTASEVFNAMNLVFENDRTPMRWELKMNGRRPIALLRVLTDRLPMQPEPRRMVYFVGDLLGDEKSGGMSINQVMNTISQVCEMTYGQAIALQFHKEAQLVVVTGSEEQITFIQTTLAALRQKVELDRNNHANSPGRGPKPEAMKPGGTAAPK